MRRGGLCQQGDERAGGGVMREGKTVRLQRVGGIRAQSVLEQVGDAVFIRVCAGSADVAALAPGGEGAGAWKDAGGEAAGDDVAADGRAGVFPTTTSTGT